MGKTRKEIAEEIVEKLNQEELKNAATVGIMLTLGLLEEILRKIRKGIEHGKEE